MKRILGVDWGLRRLGLAVSDPMQIVSSPAGIREVRSQAEALEAVLATAAEKEVEAVVVGVPVNMNGTEGEMARQARAFADQLAARAEFEVHSWDERLTTVQAERALLQGGLTRKKRKARVDAVAAQMMLQSYLDAKRSAGE